MNVSTGQALTTCPCREAEPSNCTHDLERMIGRVDVHPGYAALRLESELLIRCQLCGACWSGLPLIGGGIYGDTRWDRLD